MVTQKRGQEQRRTHGQGVVHGQPVGSTVSGTRQTSSEGLGDGPTEVGERNVAPVC